MGIIPRIAHDIFDHIYSMDENLEFHIKVIRDGTLRNGPGAGKLCWTCGLHYGTAFAAEFVLSPFCDSNNSYFTVDIYRK